MNYNELAITAQLENIGPEEQIDIQNGKVLRRQVLDFNVPSERHAGEATTKTSPAQFQAINQVIDTIRNQAFSPGDWVIVEFRLSGRKSQQRIFNNLSIIKLTKTKP